MPVKNNMPKIKLPSKQPKPPFFKEVMIDGYHFFSLKNAKIQGYYPNTFPNYPGVNLKELRLNDIITVRAIFPLETSDNVKVDGGYLDLRVEQIDEYSVFATIQTALPPDFPLETGATIEVYQEEMLYKLNTTEH